MQNQIKIFNDFKNKFLKQKKLKKEELKKLFIFGKKKFDKNEIKEDNKKIKKDEQDKIVEIEFSNGEIIQIKLSVLKKFPNSVLAAYLNSELNLPKRKLICVESVL